eukprot:7735284-Pyramimonas_sp.AAC.1
MDVRAMARSRRGCLASSKHGKKRQNTQSTESKAAPDPNSRMKRRGLARVPRLRMRDRASGRL